MAGLLSLVLGSFQHRDGLEFPPEGWCLSPDLHLPQTWNEGYQPCWNLVVGSDVLRAVLASRADGTQRPGSSKQRPGSRC